MKLKVRLSIVNCPECGLPMLAGDVYDTKLSEAECGNCGKEYEIRDTGKGLEPIIKEKKVS